MGLTATTKERTYAPCLFIEREIAIYVIDSFTVISQFTYDTFSYVHQGWFSEDHITLFTDDELDELDSTSGTDSSKCYIFDVTKLDGEIGPPVQFVTPSDHPSIDHNLYTIENYVYEASYTSGARIRKILENNNTMEVTFFDGEQNGECAAEPCDCDFFAETWTYFPYFDSGITIAGGIADSQQCGLTTPVKLCQSAGLELGEAAEYLFILQPVLDGCYGSISKFVLFDAELGIPVGDIEDGDFAVPLSGRINTEAAVDDECVDEVNLIIAGEGGEDDGRFDDRNERSAPYTLYGDANDVFGGYGKDRFACDTTYTIEASPDGDAFETKKIVFGFECHAPMTRLETHGQNSRSVEQGVHV